MRIPSVALCVFMMTGSVLHAQNASRPLTGSFGPGSTEVDFELMTWPEVKSALEHGKTTALVFNGGTEQRGPQGVNGKHTLVGRTIVREVALKLGNAIAAPVLPFAIDNASPDLPGTIGLPGPLFSAVNEQVAEQLIVDGFKNIVFMGDSGGGQQELAQLAKKLDEKYAGKGIRVVHCDDNYRKVTTDFNRWLTENNLPLGNHASIKDTSELLYLGGDKGWIRKELIATAVGEPARRPGEARDPNAPRVRNGISGDARPSTAEIGKRVIDMKVDYAVAQIRQLLAPPSSQAAR